MRRRDLLWRRLCWHLLLLQIVLYVNAASGQLALTSSALNFGGVQEGSNSTIWTSARNTSRRNITISQVSVSGTGFSFSGPSLPITLAPEQSTSLSVSFAPQAAGAAHGSMSVVTERGSDERAWTRMSTISLSGTGTTPGSSSETGTTAGSPPVITSATSASGAVGSAFAYQITATNSPTSYAASGLPTGLTVNTSTGWIAGTPMGAGTSTVTVSATDSGGTGSASLTLTIDSAAPVITSATSASGAVGSGFSYQITATNSPTSYAATSLPTGLIVNTSTGLISGTPTGAGTSTVTVSATNSGGTGSASLTLTIDPAAPVITSATSASGAVGSAFSYQIAATNSPTSYAATGLPTGLAVNTSTGLVSGTPTISGTSSVTIGATNASGTGSATLTLSIASTSYSVTISWTASPSPDAAGNAIIGYNIFRSTTSGGAYTQLNSSLIAGTTYMDPTVADGTTYYYVATAVDSSDAQSAYSTQTQAVIP